MDDWFRRHCIFAVTFIDGVAYEHINRVYGTPGGTSNPVPSSNKWGPTFQWTKNQDSFFDFGLSSLWPQQNEISVAVGGVMDGSAESGEYTLFGNWDGTGPTGVLLRIEPVTGPDRIEWLVNDTAGTRAVNTTELITLGQHFDILATFAEGRDEMFVFLDGVKSSATGTPLGAVKASTANAYVGNTPHAPSTDGWDGTISYVYVFDYGLDQAHATILHDDPFGPFWADTPFIVIDDVPGSGDVSVTLTPATFTATAVAVTPTVGLTVAVTPAAASFTAVTVTPLVGVTAAVTPSVATFTAVAVSPAAAAAVGQVRVNLGTSMKVDTQMRSIDDRSL